MIGGATVARGQVELGLNDRAMALGLKKSELDFKRSMERMDGQQATATVRADLKRLKKDLKEADASIKAWEKKREAASTAHERRSTAQFLRNARNRRDALRNELDQHEKISDELAEQIRQQEYRSKLEATHIKQGQDHLKVLKQQSRAEYEAYTAASKHERQVASLQVQYRKAAEQAEKLRKESTKARTIVSPANQQRVRIEHDHAVQSMIALRTELEAIGAKPINLDVDIDENNKIADLLRTISTTTVRVGPFTLTIGKMIRVIGYLGPAISGVIGWLGALTGAFAGATAAVGGLAGAMGTGFVLAAGGIFGITKPLIQDFLHIKKVTDANTKALQEYGKGSTQYETAHGKLVHLLKSVPPETRKQYEELGKLNSRWKELTKQSRPRFFKFMGEGIQTVSDMMPNFAKRSNEAFKNVTQGITGWMRALRSPQGQTVVDQIFGNFNASIPSLLSGIGNLAAAAGKFFGSFSRYLPGITADFDAWAKGLNGAADDTGTLNGRVDKLMGSLRGVGRLFSATGRVIYQFFRAGLGPGTDSLNDMAGSLDRLADRMETVSGQAKMRDFFEESIGTASRLWGALKPILALFIEWTTILRPFTNAALEMAGALSGIVRAIAGFGPVKGLVQVAFAAFLTKGIANRVRDVTTAFRGLRAAILSIGALSAGSALMSSATNAAAVGTTAARNASMGGAGVMPWTIGGAGGQRMQGWRGRVVTPPSVGKPPPIGRWTKLGTAMTAVTTATLGFSAATAGIGIAAIAAGYGIYKLSTRVSDYEKTVKSAQDAQKAAGEAFNVHAQLGQELPRTVLGREMAQENVKQLEKQLKGLTRGTTQYKQTLLQLRQARLDESDASREYRDTLKKETEARTKGYEAAQAALGRRTEARTKAHAALRDEGPEGRIADDLHRQGTSISDLIKMYPGLRSELVHLAEAEKAFNDQTRRTTRANELLSLGIVNQTREMNGLAGMTGKAAKAYHDIHRIAGQKIATDIAMKYDDPNKAERVGRAAAGALRKGVGKKQVMGIVANTRNIDLAVARLRAVRFAPKRFQIVEDGGEDAIRMLEKIARRKLTKKEQKVAMAGGIEALNLLIKLSRIRLQDKRFRVAVADSATNVLRGVQSLINNLHDKTINIHTNYSASGRAPGGARAQAGAEASGGAPWDRGAGGPSDKIIAAAHARAEQRGVRTTHGGKYRNPTLLVGEEDRSEYVIATNPAYRSRNVRFLGAAAADMGYTLIDAAAKGIVPKRGKRDRRKGSVYDRKKTNRGGRTGATRSMPFDRNKGTRWDAAFYGHGGAPLEDVQARRQAAQDDLDAWTTWAGSDPGKDSPHARKRWKANKPSGPGGKERKHIRDQWDRYLKKSTSWDKRVQFFEQQAQTYDTLMNNPQLTRKQFENYKGHRMGALRKLHNIYGRAFNFARQHPKHRGQADTLWESKLLELLGQNATDRATTKLATFRDEGEQVGKSQADTYAEEAYAVLRDYMGNVALGGVAGDAISAPMTQPDLPGGNPAAATAAVAPRKPKMPGKRQPKNWTQLQNRFGRKWKRAHPGKKPPFNGLVWVRGLGGGPGAGVRVRNGKAVDKHGKVIGNGKLTLAENPALRGHGVKTPGAKWASNAATASAASISATATGATAAGVQSSGTVVNKTVNQTNNYAAPPPDPHTFSQGTLYELQAA